MAIHAFEAERCAVCAFTFPSSHSGNASARCAHAAEPLLTLAVCRQDSPRVTPSARTTNGGQSCFQSAQWASGFEPDRTLSLPRWDNYPPSSEPVNGTRSTDPLRVSSAPHGPGRFIPKIKKPLRRDAEGARKSVDSVGIYVLATPPAQKRPSCEFSFVSYIVVMRARSMRRLFIARQEFFLLCGA